MIEFLRGLFINPGTILIASLLIGMAAFISIAISIAFWVIGLIWKSGE